MKVNSQQNGSYESFDIEISYFGNSGYVIPNSNHNTSITIYISLKTVKQYYFLLMLHSETQTTHIVC